MDLHFRMMVRSTLLFIYLFTFILENNIGYIIDQNEEYQYIKTINLTIIILTNCSFFIIPIIIYFSLDRILINIISLIDLIIRSLCFSMNCSVIFNPDFTYFSFYLWNICLFLLIGCNYYLNVTYHYIVNNKLPGYQVKTNKACPICFENNSNWTLPCNHCFHKKCIQKWFQFNKTCPNCRKEFPYNS